MDILIDQFENFYSVFLAAIQWNMLSSTGGSLIESLYGLKRTNTLNGNNRSISKHTAGLSVQQKILSIAFMVVLPRVMQHLYGVAQAVTDRAAAAAAAAAAAEATTAVAAAASENSVLNNLNTAPPLSNTTSLRSSPVSLTNNNDYHHDDPDND